MMAQLQRMMQNGGNTVVGHHSQKIDNCDSMDHVKDQEMMLLAAKKRLQLGSKLSNLAATEQIMDSMVPEAS